MENHCFFTGLYPIAPNPIPKSLKAGDGFEIFQGRFSAIEVIKYGGEIHISMQGEYISYFNTRYISAFQKHSKLE